MPRGWLPSTFYSVVSEPLTRNTISRRTRRSALVCDIVAGSCGKASFFSRHTRPLRARNLGCRLAGWETDFETILGGASLRALSRGAVSDFPLHRIHSIELKFTIDKHTESMVPLRVLSRTNLAAPSRHSRLNSRPFNFLRPLDRLQKSQLLWNQANPPSFCKTPARGGIPLRELVRCTEAQKCLSVSPLFATLTHSVLRKSFPCHSYANTRDGVRNASPPSFAPPSHAPRGASIPCALTRLRMLPVTTGVYAFSRPSSSHSKRVNCPRAATWTFS